MFEEEFSQEEVKKTKSIVKKVTLGIIGFIIFMMLMSSIVIINAGERGILLTWGAVTGTLEEGLHFKIPFAQGVKAIDVKTVKLEIQALAYSKDIQTVNSMIALNYHLNPGEVGTLYKEIGTSFEERIIAPSVKEAVKAITAQYTAQDLIEKRGEVKDGIKGMLTDRLLRSNIIVDEFSIVNFDFSQAYEQAVEAKQVAQQDALTSKNKLEQVKFEAEQRVAQAEAEARAIQIQAEAITQQGGSEYVNLKAVEKWDGKLPTQMIPNGTLPFINLIK